ncbi:hypothetical protein [Streptomyces rhizosphaerihabitans]|uniref:hypothetical protein n=1 Tax=Streptomyces rhizosphaerihabitans TaxID=1266770 RepID=UPI0021BF7468|nr:hypothetical protein [Streptomyces rhizosphaerihabitans]MCT9008222.1 hypothetical protein [Streptomyces rhizosphaerihabitans]
MLRLMDWSVVAMGCALVLVVIGIRWWERFRTPKGESPDQDTRRSWVWLPLLMGLAMIAARLPGLVHAPHPVVELVDALTLVIAVTGLVIAVRSARHAFRARGTV